MSQEDFISVVSAVLAANLLTGWAVYAVWHINKMDKAGAHPSKAPWVVLLGFIVPALVAAFGAYLVASTAG